MRHPIIYLVLVFMCLTRLSANTDERVWTLESGKSFRAELVRYDEAAGKVVLKLNNNAENQIFDANEFSVVDRAWLTEWLEFEESLDAKLKTLGGRVEHLVTTGQYPTDLFVYYPTARQQSGPLPGLILFHPGGKAGRHLKRHMEAGEKTGLVLIACGSFRNESTEAEAQANEERFKEIFPQILQRVAVDPNRLFLGGTSGGALRAYRQSALIKHHWAGIYANGGWLGGEENYNLPYPSGMRVVMVNGNQDAAANYYVKPDGAVLTKAGNLVGVISFEGGHQEPPVRSQIMAFNWLLGQEDSPATKPSPPVE